MALDHTSPRIAHLRRAHRKSSKWLVAHAHQFCIDLETGLLSDREAAIPWHVKPLGELILLLLILSRHRRRSRRLSALTEQALTIAAGFDWHKLAAFDPSSASPVTMVLEFFESNNRPPPLEREYVEKLQCFSYFDGMDRLPYRSMDVIYSLSRIGFDERLDELGALYRQTPMGLDQPMARYSVDDMYAITHALFYITDFGLRSPELSMTQAELSELRVALPTMLVLLFRADNVDLVAEVLLCWQFCGFQPEPAEKLVLGAALFCVLENQTKSGAVASTIDARNRELSTGAHFYELYHTTLVAAMLFALWGSRR